MSTLDTLGQSFQERLYGQFSGEENWQKEAWDRFLTLGLPSQKNEVYRYVRLRDLYNSDFNTSECKEVTSESVEKCILPECSRSRIVLIDGVYCETLSKIPNSLIALPLSEAYKTYRSFLSQRWKNWLEEEKDAFALLNGALYREGLFLYLPPKCILEEPLQIVHLLTRGGMFFPRIHFFGGKNSACKMYLTQEVGEEKYWINSFFDLNLEEGSQVRYTSLLNEKESGSHVDAIRVSLKKESRFQSYAMTNGSALVRQDYVLGLKGERAEAEIYGVWSLSNTAQAHVNVLMDHQQPHCRSLQKFKGVLSDHSRCSFEGKIYVHQLAQKTEAYQMNNNLILSKHALANSKPNLEIFADDVKASHGATVGQLDEEQLFYLKSRGISEKFAKKMLVQGFSREILDRIELPSFQKLAISTLHDEFN